MIKKQVRTQPNIGLISHHSHSISQPTKRDRDPADLCTCAVGLARQGHQVHWITSTTAVKMDGDGITPVLWSESDIPTTCRYVVPCQPYRLDGVTLFGVDPHVWPKRSLHTRLFSFLCLLHQALNWDILHVWGPLDTVYLAVYTARFLEIPVVVSYGDAMFDHEHVSSFVWQWVNRQVSMVIVSCEANRQRLLNMDSPAPRAIRVINSESVQAGAVLSGVYASLVADRDSPISPFSLQERQFKNRRGRA